MSQRAFNMLLLYVHFGLAFDLVTLHLEIICLTCPVRLFVGKECFSIKCFVDTALSLLCILLALCRGNVAPH